MEQRIQYISDGNILLREVHGKALFSEIYDSWKEIILNNEIKPGILGIINDFREAELLMEISDVKKLLELFEQNIHLFKNLKIAVVADSYKNIVFPVVGRKMTTKFEVRPFSTFEAAQNWILE